MVGSLIGQISQSTEINTLKSKKEQLLNDEKQKFTKLFRKGITAKFYKVVSLCQIFDKYANTWAFALVL